MNLGVARLTRPCHVSLYCLILRRKTKAGDNGRSPKKAPNNHNSDSIRIYCCRETPNHSANGQEELLPVKNKQLFSLMRQEALFLPFGRYDCSQKRPLTCQMLTQLHQCQNTETNPKTAQKYQSKKMLFSASVADRDQWVIAHLRNTS